MTDPGDAGWRRLGPDPRIAAWAEAARPAARAAVAAAPGGWRCGATWFAGVDALPNGPDGSIGGAPFPWDALPLAPAVLHRGQVSVVRAGYPRPDPGETEAAARFRRDRDAAHLDGLIGEGRPPRRFIREPHAWILGIPLDAAEASPLVVWEGSHAVLRERLLAALAVVPPDRWGETDVTEAYVAARAEAFRLCRRVVLRARPGQATLLHRLALHGVAPWDGEGGPADGRMIAYFRPLLPSVEAWLRGP